MVASYTLGLIGHAATEGMLAVLAALGHFTLRHTSLKGTSAHVQLLGRHRRGTDVKVEDVHREAQSGACIGNINNASDVPLDRST